MPGAEGKRCTLVHDLSSYRPLHYFYTDVIPDTFRINLGPECNQQKLLTIYRIPVHLIINIINFCSESGSSNDGIPASSLVPP